MDCWIPLIRGINVGGRKKVAMWDIRDLLETIGLKEIKSLLQSGNLLFHALNQRAADLEQLLEQQASDHLDIEVDFLLRGAREWKAIVAQNPFPDEARQDPSHLAVMCLKDPPSKARATALSKAIAGREVVRAIGRQLYIVYPDGIGRSRLTHALIEKTLGIRGTARNWTTVLKIAAAARGMCAKPPRN